jgi:hypothetical protein
MTSGSVTSGSGILFRLKRCFRVFSDISENQLYFLFSAVIVLTWNKHKALQELRKKKPKDYQAKMEEIRKKRMAEILGSSLACKVYESFANISF